MFLIFLSISLTVYVIQTVINTYIATYIAWNRWVWSLDYSRLKGSDFSIFGRLQEDDNVLQVMITITITQGYVVELLASPVPGHSQDTPWTLNVHTW